MNNLTATEILECGHTESPITRGYGTDKDGNRYCYECCAAQDRASMIETGKATLYLSAPKEGNKFKITNWPGSLSFAVGHVRTGRHNWAGRRYDAWFTGPDGKNWHGVQYGDNTQIIHCRRIKPCS